MLKEDGEVSPINVYPFATDFYSKDEVYFTNFSCIDRDMFVIKSFTYSLIVFVHYWNVILYIEA